MTAAARLLLLLAPAVLVGVFARAYYTPDEPREASLVMSMAKQPDKSLPELAGRTFAEKPPLLYWLGAVAVGAFGPSPGALRVPNLLYAALTAVAIAALAAAAAGAPAGLAAGVAAVTMLQPYQVLIWLATDAPLLAGVALALLGAQLGLAAGDARARRRGYLVLHAGLALAFFAKGFAGWLVPASAWLTVVALERRWRELWRAELWIWAPLLVAVIGAWVLWVAARPDGPEALKILFWYNLVGRAVALDAPAGFGYAAGHGNSPGKYLVELALYLLPWTALAAAALRRIPRGLRRTDAEGSAWRFALGAIVPPTIALSFAATARGVYYAPPALGFAILIGLYAASAGAALDRFDRLAWRVTGLLIAVLAVTCGAFGLLAGLAPVTRTAVTVALGAFGFGVAIAAAWLALAPRATGAHALPRLAFALTLVLSLVLAPLYLRINAWLGLAPLAARVTMAAGDAPLVLLDPDETTLALADLYLPAAHTVVAGADPGAIARATTTLGPGARVLWLVPARPRWNVNAWLAFLGYRDAARAPAAVTPPAGLRLECVLERPGGRTLALLAPAGEGARGACR